MNCRRVKYPDSGIIGMASRYGITISPTFRDKHGVWYIAVDWDFDGVWEGQGKPPSYVTVERVLRLEFLKA